MNVVNKSSFLEKLRKSLNVSQGEIAKKLGVSRPTYVLIESGKKELSINQAKILSDLYGVSIDSIRMGRISETNLTQKEIATTTLPTSHGVFDFSVWNQPKGEEIVFLSTPNLDINKPVLVRVHSECLTGDTFDSYKCDCGEQKDKSLEMISENGNGLLIYLRQEGRGIGLYEKIRAYTLQEQGYDTHEANIILGHKPDYREYSWVKKVLDHLEVKQIKLLTNNPSKVSEISRLGIKVSDRIPLIIPSNIHNRKYFETKKEKFKHFFGKSESNYFYQFSYAENSEQIEEIGSFLINKKKDPLLKICIGIYADSKTLRDEVELRKIEKMFKAAKNYDGFVPILHFTFRFSEKPKEDILEIRKKLPFVEYLQMNDVEDKHLELLMLANKFFLVDFPLDDETFYLVEDDKFTKEIKDNKAFILLDNSKGNGMVDTKINLTRKINKLLAKGISDIAIYGGFGPDSLGLYFEMKDHYKINFSIDAESKLKSEGALDIKKVKDYLSKLMGQRFQEDVKDFKKIYCDENEIIKNIIKKDFKNELHGNVLDIGGGTADILGEDFADSKITHLDILDFSSVPTPITHERITGDILDENLLKSLGKVDVAFMCHVLQFIDSDLEKLDRAIKLLNAEKIILVEDLNDDMLGEVMKFSLENFDFANPEYKIKDFPKGYSLKKSVPFTAHLKSHDFLGLTKQCLYLMEIPHTEDNIKKMNNFLVSKLSKPEFTINQEINLYIRN